MDTTFDKTPPDAAPPTSADPLLLDGDGRVIGYLVNTSGAAIRWCHGCWDAQRKETKLEAELRVLRAEQGLLRENIIELQSLKEDLAQRFIKVYVDLQQAVRCNKCEDTPHEPVSLLCGHSFCGSCYNTDHNVNRHGQCILDSCRPRGSLQAGGESPRSVALQRMLDVLAREAKWDDWLEEFGCDLGIYYRSKERREKRQREFGSAWG